jgi:hypothetical protein
MDTQGRTFEFDIQKVDGREILTTIQLHDLSIKAVVDTAAMVTLVNENIFREVFGHRQNTDNCILHGIGTEPIKGQLVENVPISVGQYTYMQRICVAPVNDQVILGLDFLKEHGAIIDLSRDIMFISGEEIPLEVTDGSFTTSKVKVSKRSVIPPNTVGYISVELETPLDIDYIINPTIMRNCLISTIYGSGKYITLQVINDSNFYVTLKKGKIIGIAEPASLINVCNISKVVLSGDTNESENLRRCCSKRQ